MASPIHSAIKLGNLNRVRTLLNSGTNVNTRDNNRWTALMFAAWFGNLAAVKLLLDRGANVNARNNIGSTPIINATYRGHLTVVRELLDRGANINARDDEGMTALIWAAYNGRLAIVKELLKRGANTNGIKTGSFVPENVRNAIMKHKAGMTIAKYKKASNLRRRAAAAKALGNIKTPHTRKSLPRNITRTIMSMMSPRK